MSDGKSLADQIAALEAALAKSEADNAILRERLAEEQRRNAPRYRPRLRDA